ncbi:putative C6 transcription factor [Annulohypoxylon bovei var. microspora]|nr:putative C6 transcription factor [Annulohypoxylon bovei var. microspora]
MDRKASGHSAPYGQACLHCFKSKCKCVSRPDSDGCERCHRLNKQCRPSDSLRRRNVQKNHNSTARIAQLEGRLEGLISLLQSVAKSPDSSDALRKVLDESLAGHSQPGVEPQVTTPSLISNNVPEFPSTINADGDTASSPLATSLPSGTSNQSSANSLYGLSTDEADAYLTVFRSQMLKHLAFIHIPLDITAKKLGETRPFLLRAIIAVVSPSTQQKMVRGKELKRILAQNALVENQSSLDLLLGLLTYIAWGWDTFLNKSGTLSRLIMLAISIVGNLRLNKPLPKDVHMIGPLTPGFADGHQKCELEDPEQRHLERQRAVLGCFLLSSIISSYYAQTDAMRWTPQMEEGLRAISSNKECPTDEGFALQIRLQLLAQRTVHIREQQEADCSHLATAPLPSFVYLNALQGQLQELRDSIPPGFELQKILMAQVHYVDLCINESAHTANSDAPLLTTPCIGDNGYIISGFQRVECLWRSLNAIKAWLDIFFALPPSAFKGLSFPLWAQLARCIVILYRLSTLENPAWDRKVIRDTVDLIQVLERIAERLEQAGREHGGQSNDDIFIQVARLMRMFLTRVSAKIAPAEVGEAAWAYGGTAPGADGNVMVPEQNYMVPFVDFGSDEFWEEFSAGYK